MQAQKTQKNGDPGRKSSLVAGRARALASLAALLFLSSTVAAGCGDDSNGSSTPTCHAGDTRECLGPGACKGAQECLADGSGFKACECGSGGSNNGGQGPTAGTAGKPGTSGSSNNEGGNDAGGTTTEPGGAPGTGGAAQGGDGAGGTNGGAGGDGGAGPVLHVECQPVGNVGCKAQQNCEIVADGTICVPAGNKANLALCTQTSECAPGLYCSPAGNCLKPCAETKDCAADPTLHCGWQFDHSDIGIGNVGGCTKPCDVTTQNCAAKQACYLGSCLTIGQGQSKDKTCNLPIDCAKGLDCLVDVTNDGDADCTEYCSMSGANICGQGRSCYALTNAFPDAPGDWGICALMP